MTTSAIESLLSALLLGALLAASAPAAADQVTGSSIGAWVNAALPGPLVSAKDDVVTLAGRVHDSSEKSHATDVAGRVGEVREVVNENRVQPAAGTITRHSDATLANEIRDSFRRHGKTSRVADRIRVGVKDGVATLTGDLDTWDERLEAGSVALGAEGVWKVQNRLTVEGHDDEWERWEYEAPYYFYELFPNVG